MAGIGFRLQALIARGSYLEASTAYLSSVVISAGPWLSGAIALLVLSGTTTSSLSAADHTLLFATIISVFAASLLLAGGPQLLITRYLADRFYLNDRASIAPTCAGVLCLSVPVVLITLPFVLLTNFDIRYRLLVGTLFLTLTMIWMVMVFLSAARAYLRIVLIFVLCYALGIGAALVLEPRYGLLGSLAGFTLGQVTCLSLLVMSIYAEFAPAHSISFAYLGYIAKYWDLVAIGVLYTMGIWIDNFLFWLSPQAQVISGFYHLFPVYDSAKFIVYLSTVPAVALFMIHLETNFYRHYRKYYQLILNKGTLTDLEQAREGMLSAAHTGLWAILKVQGFIALFLCLIAPDLATLVGLAPQWVSLLRIETGAATGQFFVLTMMLLLLYIDQRRATLLVVGVFTLCNAMLTLGSFYLGSAFYGWGYLGATLIAAVLGWFILDSRLKRLEFLTFMAQPVGTK
jgi:uncharacterized membrane protein